MGRAHRNGAFSLQVCKAPRGSKGDHFLTESGPPPFGRWFPLVGLFETFFFFLWRRCRRPWRLLALSAKWPLALGAAMEVVAVCGSAKAVNIIAAVVMIPVTNTKLSRKYGDPP